MNLYRQVSIDFLFLLTRVTTCDLDLWEDLDINILFYLQTFISKVASFALFFLFSLKKNHWVSPIMCFFIAPQPDHALKCSIRVFFRDEAVWKKDLVIYNLLFYGEFLKFQSYSKHKNHFDIGLKQTCSKNNSSDSYR